MSKKIGTKINEQMSSFLRDELKVFKGLQIFIAALCIFIPVILMWFDKDEFYPQKLNPNEFNIVKNQALIIKIDTITKIHKGRHEDAFKITACPVGTDIPGLPVLDAETLRKDRFCFRKSLSHYALSSNSYLFGMLYSMAAMMFIYNAAVYWKLQKGNNESSQLAELEVNKSEPIYNLVIGISLILVILYPIDKQSFRGTLHVIFSLIFFAGNLSMIVFCPNKYEGKLDKKTRIIAALVFVAVMFFLIVKDIISILDVEWITLTFIALHLILTALVAHDKISENKIAKRANPLKP